MYVFEPSWRGEHDAVKIISLPLVRKKFEKTPYSYKIDGLDFDDLWGLYHWP